MPRTADDWVCVTLNHFRKSHIMCLGRLLVRDSSERGWGCCSVGWDRASGNHHGGVNGVNQVNGKSDLVPT